MRFYVEAFVPKLFMIFELNSATKRFNNLLRYLRGKLLFIPFMIFEKCSISFKL